MRDLAGLSPRDLAFNAAYLIASWAIILTSVVIAARHPSSLTIGLAFVLVSSRQQALLNLSHECIHSLFVRGRIWNERIGAWLCAYPCGSPFLSTRNHHLAHHRALATSGDPDAALHTGTDKRTRRGLARHFLVGFLGGYALRVLASDSTAPIDPSIRARDRRNLIVCHLGLFALSSATVGAWVYPVLWLAPLATLTTLSHLVRSYCEHALQPREEAAFGGRLISIRSNALEAFIVAPYFMKYHAEHHLFPWVPSQKLAQVERRLAAAGASPARLVRSTYARTLATHVRALPAR